MDSTSGSTYALKGWSNEKVTSGIVAINAWKAHFKKFR
jgi:hypothetical protein